MSTPPKTGIISSLFPSKSRSYWKPLKSKPSLYPVRFMQCLMSSSRNVFLNSSLLGAAGIFSESVTIGVLSVFSGVTTAGSVRTVGIFGEEQPETPSRETISAVHKIELLIDKWVFIDMRFPSIYVGFIVNVKYFCRLPCN